MSGLVYLASPYSHPFRDVRNWRFETVCKKAAELMEEGYQVFCPIAHSHSIEINGFPKLKSGDWWLQQDFAILKHCDKMIVYKMNGWDKSYGVKKEIAFCKKHKIPVEYIDD